MQNIFIRAGGLTLVGSYLHLQGCVMCAWMSGVVVESALSTGSMS